MHTAIQRREPPLKPKHRCGHCFVLAVVLGAVCWAGAADGREFERPVKIGVLTTSWGAPPPVVGLRDGLVERGYREDVDFTIGVRFTQGSTEALSEAARGLVRGGSDIIVPIGSAAAKAAQEATGEIAIVFVGGSDPVGAGLVESFARPGGNLTGVTLMDDELGGKRLEILVDYGEGTDVGDRLDLGEARVTK